MATSMNMKNQHTTEVDRGSRLFKRVQDLLDKTRVKSMCGVGRDVRHKQRKQSPYNRLEAVRVYQLNNAPAYVVERWLR